MTPEEAVARAIGRLLGGLCEAVILDGHGGYVQFASDAGDVRFEAAGDDNLAEPLGFEQLRALSRLGFFPPDAQSAGNHWQHSAAREPALLARLALDALQAVYGVAADDVEINEV